MDNAAEPPLEQKEYLNGYLDGMMEVYGKILGEWEEFQVVKPKAGAHVNFACNDCGKCCCFEDHWVWVYPSDLIRWLNKFDSEKIIPLLLGILFPVEDMDGAIGYGLPSQKTLHEKFTEFIATKGNSAVMQNTFKMLLKQIKILNPSFDNSSDYCIFYKSNSSEGHCLIYDHRPIQCRTYPLDFPQFSDMVIPPELEDQYGAYDADIDNLPLCPAETFTGGKPQEGVMINEEELQIITEEKSNYIASLLTQEWQEVDISDILLEVFYEEILNLGRESRFIQKGGNRDKNNTSQKKKFVSGKRPLRNRGNRGKSSPHSKKKSKKPKKSKNKSQNKQSKPKNPSSK